MSKRHRDALAISAGAVNPSGMAHSLVAACKECIDEGVSQQTDPAVRLIVSQIAYICGIWDGISAWPLTPVGNSSLKHTGDFDDATRACERRVDEVIKGPVTYVIRNAEGFYWSNADGWVRLRNATAFSAAECDSFALPTGGEWVVAL